MKASIPHPVSELLVLIKQKLPNKLRDSQLAASMFIHALCKRQSSYVAHACLRLLMLQASEFCTFYYLRSSGLHGST